MEIAPGIHAVEEVRGSNAILLAGERVAVVDTGFAGNSDAILRGIKAIGRSPRDLAWIILTHHHLDHSGTAAELHELTGAAIVAHAAEAEPTPDGGLLLRKGTERQHIPIWYRWLIRGFRAPKLPDPIFPETPVHQTVEHGDVLPCLEGVRILHTPGHTPGSICLRLGKVLLTGDTLFPGGPGATKYPGGDFATIIRSIEDRLFAKLDADTIVMPGHGDDTTIGTERPHLQEWIDRGW